MYDPFVNILPLHFVEPVIEGWTVDQNDNDHPMGDQKGEGTSPKQKFSKRIEMLRRAPVSVLQDRPIKDILTLFLDFPLSAVLRTRFRYEWKTAGHQVEWNSAEWTRVVLQNWSKWESQYGSALRPLVLQEFFGITRERMNAWLSEKANDDVITFEPIPPHLQVRLRYWSGSDHRFKLHCDHILSLKKYLYEQRRHQPKQILHPYLRFPLSAATLSYIDNYSLLKAERQEMILFQEQSDAETTKRKKAHEHEDQQQATALEKHLMDVEAHDAKIRRMHGDGWDSESSDHDDDDNQAQRTLPLFTQSHKTQQQHPPPSFDQILTNQHQKGMTEKQALHRALDASRQHAKQQQMHDEEQMKLALRLSLSLASPVATKKLQREQKESHRIETQTQPDQDPNAAFDDELLTACFQSGELALTHQQQQQKMIDAQPWGFTENHDDDDW